MLLLNSFLTVPASLPMEGSVEDGRTGESQSLPKAFLFQEVLPCFLYNSVFVSIMEHLHWPARKHEGEGRCPSDTAT